MNLNLTLIGQLIAFTIFVVFCMKYVWPPISGALADRQKKIAEGLDAADKAVRDLESAKSQIEDELNSLRLKKSCGARRGVLLKSCYGLDGVGCHYTRFFGVACIFLVTIELHALAGTKAAQP